MQRSIVRGWILAVPLNTALGVLGWAALMWLGALLHGVAGALGWVPPTDIFRDGVLVPVASVVFLWLLFLVPACTLNPLLLRRYGIPMRIYGWAAACLLLMPSAAMCAVYGWGVFWW